MKKGFFFAFLGIALAVILVYISGLVNNKPVQILSPVGENDLKLTPTPILLDRYSIASLRVRSFAPSDVALGKVVEENDSFMSRIFYFKSENRKVSGLVNIPKLEKKLPAVILLRGFVDRSIYSPGVGSKRIGQYLAQNGFVTVAPDFLGYGESDNPSIDSLEARFQTYTTVLSLIESLPNFNKAFKNSKDHAGISIDPQNFGIWAHSNGGQITLAILEATGKEIPAVLWAPVTKPFPYSVLYFTDEAEDKGKALRKVIADFEVNHDITKFCPTTYLDWIEAPIQFHQGGSDIEVPQHWSDDFVDQMKKLKKDIEYFTYPSADHNFSTEDWNNAASRSLDYFKNKLGI